MVLYVRPLVHRERYHTICDEREVLVSANPVLVMVCTTLDLLLCFLLFLFHNEFVVIHALFCLNVVPCLLLSLSPSDAHATAWVGNPVRPRGCVRSRHRWQPCGPVGGRGGHQASAGFGQPFVRRLGAFQTDAEIFKTLGSVLF